MNSDGRLERAADMLTAHTPIFYEDSAKRISKKAQAVIAAWLDNDTVYVIVDQPGLDMTEMWENLFDEGSLVPLSLEDEG